MRRLLVAARGSTAARVVRSARRLGIVPVGCAVAADRDATWTRHLTDLVEVPAYDDPAALVRAATALGADAVHAGTGLAAESPVTARAVTGAGLTWVGPSPEVLERLADKSALVALAAQVGVPVPVTSAVLGSAAELGAFVRAQGGPVVLKTVHGGGGRGVVRVPGPGQAAAAWQACAGLGPLLAQVEVAGSRHVEVQCLGDGHGAVVTLGTRECSVQRRAQKVLEEAPAPGLTPDQVRALESASRRVLGAAGLAGAATCEFLLPQGSRDTTPLLLEVNARLQVEHAVTEEVTGVDLVAAQLLLAQGTDLVEAVRAAGDAMAGGRRTAAGGRSTHAAGAGPAPVGPMLLGAGTGAGRVETSGHAVEVRLYAEDPVTLVPAAGLLRALELPLSLPGPARVRVERGLWAGDAVRPDFSDPLALVSTCAASRDEALDALAALLDRVEVVGPPTLVPLLRHVLDDDDLRATPPAVSTRWLETVALARFVTARCATTPGWAATGSAPPPGDDPALTRPGRDPGCAGATRVLTASAGDPPTDPPGVLAPSGHEVEPVLRSPLPGVVVARSGAAADEVRQGEVLAVVEAMKMRLPLTAPLSGRLTQVPPAVGTPVRGGEVLARLAPTPSPDQGGAATSHPVRASRGPAVTGGRWADGGAPVRRRPTARQRAQALADDGSLTEVVEGDAVLTARARLDGRPVALWAQDPTVLHGTIGLSGARRVAALIERAASDTVPVVALLDSGGARVQDGVDALAGVALLLRAAARARGRTLQLALVLGPAAGGAAYAPALADLVVMVEGSASLFLTGPGVVRRATGEVVDVQELGGADVHARSAGTAHLTVPQETEAWVVAREVVACAPLRRLGEMALPLVPGGAGAAVTPLDAGTATVVPVDPGAVYDVRDLLARLTDRGEVIELRPRWAPCVVTALARVEGVPVGVVATQPAVGAGALTPSASQKVAEHVRLCSDLGLPLLTVLDTPGFLPGTAAEADGAVRHGAAAVEAYVRSRSRLVTLVTRKAFGGAYVALGSAPLCGATALAWPTAHLGVMDALSAVHLTRRRELTDLLASGGPGARDRRLSELVAEQERTEEPGRAVEAGWVTGVVDPEHTRARLVAELGRGAVVAPVAGIRHPGDGWVDCGCGSRHWGQRGAAGVLAWRWTRPGRPGLEAAGAAGGAGTAGGAGAAGGAGLEAVGAAGGGIEVLLQLRAVWTHQGGTWGLPGGAIAEGEDAWQAALRECEEEAGIPAPLLVPGGRHVQTHPDWTYTTLAAQAPWGPEWDRLVPADRESDALAWVALEVDDGGRWAAPSDRDLLPALGAVWPELAPLLPRPRQDW